MLIPIQAPENASSAATATTTTHDSPFNARRHDDEINMQILPMCTQGSLKRNCNHVNSNAERSQTLDRRSSSGQEYSPTNSIIDYSFTSSGTTRCPPSNNADKVNRNHCKGTRDNDDSCRRSRNNLSPSCSLASFTSSRSDSITRLQQQQQQSDSSRSSLASNNDDDINCNKLRETNKCRRSNTYSLDNENNPSPSPPRTLLEQKHHTVSLDSGCSSDPSEEKDRLLQANNTKNSSKYAPMKHHDRRLLLCQRNNNKDVESAISKTTTSDDKKLQAPWEPLLRASLSSNCESMLDDSALRSL